MEALAAKGMLDSKSSSKLKLLKDAHDKILEKKQEEASKQKPKELKKAKEAEELENQTQMQFAQYSIYYDPHLNPFGAPPPGKPQLYRGLDGAVSPFPPVLSFEPPATMPPLPPGPPPSYPPPAPFASPAAPSASVPLAPPPPPPRAPPPPPPRPAPLLATPVPPPPPMHRPPSLPVPTPVAASIPAHVPAPVPTLMPTLPAAPAPAPHPPQLQPINSLYVPPQHKHDAAKVAANLAESVRSFVPTSLTVRREVARPANPRPRASLASQLTAKPVAASAPSSLAASAKPQSTTVPLSSVSSAPPVDTTKGAGSDDDYLSFLQNMQALGAFASNNP
eukprot:GILK01009832.1.p1 GENE.GILK01009832.1~~GILK01009832.1.p1  ORF type:complete len:394 (+),score=83.90 GILK01009832.1:179-1183(+)